MTCLPISYLKGNLEYLNSHCNFKEIKKNHKNKKKINLGAFRCFLEIEK